MLILSDQYVLILSDQYVLILSDWHVLILSDQYVLILSDQYVLILSDQYTLILSDGMVFKIVYIGYKDQSLKVNNILHTKYDCVEICCLPVVLLAGLNTHNG